MQAGLWSMGALLIVVGVSERCRKNRWLGTPSLIVGFIIFTLGCLVL
jgi:uncharacterized membrane protein (DUF4010 family)